MEGSCRMAWRISPSPSRADGSSKSASWSRSSALVTAGSSPKEQRVPRSCTFSSGMSPARTASRTPPAIASWTMPHVVICSVCDRSRGRYPFEKQGTPGRFVIPGAITDGSESRVTEFLRDGLSKPPIVTPEGASHPCGNHRRGRDPPGLEARAALVGGARACRRSISDDGQADRPPGRPRPGTARAGLRPCRRRRPARCPDRAGPGRRGPGGRGRLGPGGPRGARPARAAARPRRGPEEGRGVSPPAPPR